MRPAPGQVLHFSEDPTIRRSVRVGRRRCSYPRLLVDGYEVHQVGGRSILEYWIPADDLDELNRNIVGTITVVAEYR